MIKYTEGQEMKSPPSLKLRRANAEREGFEPPVPVTVHLISNQAH